MRPILALIACVASAAPALAQDWLSPSEFEAIVEGKATVLTDEYGDVFGTEHFLPDRRVIWQYALDNSCLFGRWQAKGASVCYSYDNGPENCLRYQPDGAGLLGVEWNDGLEGSSYRLRLKQAPAPECPAS